MCIHIVYTRPQTVWIMHFRCNKSKHFIWQKLSLKLGDRWHNFTETKNQSPHCSNFRQIHFPCCCKYSGDDSIGEKQLNQMCLGTVTNQTQCPFCENLQTQMLLLEKLTSVFQLIAHAHVKHEWCFKPHNYREKVLE